MHIRTLHTLTPAEVRDLAHAAAERGEALATANPFDPDTEHHEVFAVAFNDRQRELQPECCT